ncbi:hypothetical protein ABF176_002381 [Flavobacterium psychrophilum]
MKLEKIEYKLANGRNQFSLVNEQNLTVGVVAGFSNNENLKHATVLENSFQLLEALQALVKFCKGNNVGAELEFAEEVLMNANA